MTAPGVWASNTTHKGRHGGPQPLPLLCTSPVCLYHRGCCFAPGLESLELVERQALDQPLLMLKGLQTKSQDGCFAYVCLLCRALLLAKKMWGQQRTSMSSTP